MNAYPGGKLTLELCPTIPSQSKLHHRWCRLAAANRFFRAVVATAAAMCVPSVTNFCNPVNLRKMVSEASAGGVVVRRKDGEWWVAVIEPAEKRVKAEPRKKIVFALPKGLIDPGEKAVEAAVREVREEAGVAAEPVRKLADNRYIYVRTWGGREKVSKIVSFYLMRYLSGRINHISEEMRGEVRRASWVRLQDAPGLLAYGGERQVARKALAYLTKTGGLRPGHSEG